MLQCSAGQKKELDNCFFVRTVMMILIVIYHSIVFWSANKWFVVMPSCQAEVLGALADYLNTFHVYTFVLVSGYVYYALRFEQGKYERTFPFLINKTKRLLVPYVFTSIIWVIPHNLIWYKPDTSKIINDFVLGLAPDQLWFLLMLFWVYLIAYPLSNFAKKYAALAIPLLISIYIVGVVLPFPNYFQIKTALRCQIFFWIGFYIRELDLLCLFRGKKKWIRIGIISVSFVVLFFAGRISYPKTAVYKILFIVIDIITRMVGAITAFCLLQMIAGRVKQYIYIYISGFSKYSMIIFLFHQQIIQCTLAFCKGIHIPLLISGICFAVALITSTLMAAVVYKVKPLRICFTGKA